MHEQLHPKAGLRELPGVSANSFKPPKKSVGAAEGATAPPTMSWIAQKM